MSRPFDAISWMWGEALAALENAERLHGRFFGLISTGTAPKWEPPIDMYETDDGLVILVALPGIAPGSVSVFIDSKGFVIQTERVPDAARNCLRIRRMEIPFGAYERRIDLPIGSYTLRRQEMADGCLELHLTRTRP